MVTITFIDADGRKRNVEVKPGLTVMEAAVQNGVKQILAECGGAVSCGTCHVYISEPWISKVPLPDDGEDDMLEYVLERKEGSRLSCQIRLTEQLDGMIVYLPRVQAN